MTGRFTVLASGSSGNAALLETDGFGLLIDCGLHPRVLHARLREAGASWDAVNAVILTHIHGDHWKDLTLAGLKGGKIPLYAHGEHLDHLSTAARSYDSLHRARLAREYADGQAFELQAGLVVRPLQVSHDAEPTFAFRIDRRDSQGAVWSIGYASDLGCGSTELIELFTGVDVLALEFNHDVRMERRSRRPRFLIDRVLSDWGHLSNEQGADLARAIVQRSERRAPEHLVQLHLSRDCNHPDLAAKAAHAALGDLSPGIRVTTTRQGAAARSIPLARRVISSERGVEGGITAKIPPRHSSVQATLPGFE